MKHLCAIFLVTACSGAQRGDLVGGLIDCAKADRGELLGLAVELGVSAVNDVKNTQEVNWEVLGLRALAKGVQVGGCAFSRFVLEWAKQSTPAIAEGTVARRSDPGRAKLEQLRAHWGGVKWSVEP